MDPDVSAVALRHPSLRVVLLHGSRARGDAHSRSDWDLGYLADDGADHLGLVADLVAILGTDDVDVADLARASALLRFTAARDGRCLYERSADEHQTFVLEATLFWCDAEAVIRRAGEAVLAERKAAVEGHLRRVRERLPADGAELRPMSDATDAVVLHLWQAVQIVIDLAVSTCVRSDLGSPPTYGDAFRRLGEHGVVPVELAARLAGAAGFRNLVVHAYADLDLRRVRRVATTGPLDLVAFLAALRDHLDQVS